MILGQRDLGFQPKLGFPVRVLYVYVRPRLFAREEKESVTTDAEDRWTHRRQDTR
jgi:hypothetical protein